MNTRVYIALGSNLGDREAMIGLALDAMSAAGIRILRRSSLYTTEPVDAPPQPWFLNAVAETETPLQPLPLLRAIAAIESDLGRQRLIVNGPRTMDLDILLYGSSVIRTPELAVPHPRLHLRRFVLAPLAELAPALEHPVLHKSMAELLSLLPTSPEVRRWPET